MLSSGRQAALAMHEACSNLMISEILNFRTTGEGGAALVFLFLFVLLWGFFLEGNFPFVNQLGNVVFRSNCKCLPLFACMNANLEPLY